MFNIHERDDGVTIECYVTPKAGKSKIKGERNGALAVALAAPPVEGRANKALIEFLADLFSIPKTRISILRGETARLKLLHIKGIGMDEIVRIVRLSFTNSRFRE